MPFDKTKYGDDKFNIYPNPTSNGISVVSRQDEPAFQKLFIYNSNAILIHEKELSDIPAYEFNFDHYPAGIYLCIIRNASGQTIYSKKLILQKE